MGLSWGYASLTSGCDIARVQRAGSMRTYSASIIFGVVMESFINLLELKADFKGEDSAYMSEYVVVNSE